MIAVARQLRHCRDTMGHDDAAAIIDSLQRAQAALYEHGDPEPVRQVLTADVEWIVPGASPIAGSYRGVDETVAYMLARRELAGGSFRMNRRALLTGEGYIAALTDGRATIAGREHTWSTVGLYEPRDGRIASCRLIPFDQAQFDAIWSG